MINTNAYQVVSEELHDESRVLVALLAQGVKFYRFKLASSYFQLVRLVLTGNRIVESLLREVASLIGSVEDLVVEDGEVQGETKTDGVCGGQLGLGNLGSSLVRLKRLVSRLLSSITNGEFSKITVVVALPVLVG